MSAGHVRPGDRDSLGPATRATEPRTYDRRVYLRVLVACLIVLALAVGFTVYSYWFKTTAYSRPYFDLSSLFMRRGFLLPDLSNPCIALQENLDATRSKEYEKAYDSLSQGLRGTVSLEAFVNNAKSNSLLFRGVSGYVSNECAAQGNLASCVGYIEYTAGGRSRVEASMVWEENRWKISQMTIIFQ